MRKYGTLIDSIRVYENILRSCYTLFSKVRASFGGIWYLNFFYLLFQEIDFFCFICIILFEFLDFQGMLFFISDYAIVDLQVKLVSKELYYEAFFLSFIFKKKRKISLFILFIILIMAYYGWTPAQSAWDIPYLNRKIFLFRYQIFKSDFFCH